MGLWSALFGPRPPAAAPVHLDEACFQAEVLASTLPVMLDAWGPDCAPCRRLEPVVLALAARYAGRVKVAELNVEACPEAAARLVVQGTPTVIFFLGGREVERVVGYRGELYLDEIIRTELLGEPSPG